jgi:hypothetical protein
MTKIKICNNIDRNLLKLLKRHAVEEEVKINTLLEEGLRKLLEKKDLEGKQGN